MKGIGIDTNGTVFAKIKRVEDLVKESIKRIILTRNGERVGHYDVGIGFQKYLFTNMTYLKSKQFRELFLSEMMLQEPRIDINSFNFNQTDTNSIQFIMNYKVKDEYTEGELIEDQMFELNFRGE